MIEHGVYFAAEFPLVLEWQVRDFVRIVCPDSHVDSPSVPLGDVNRDPINFVIVDGAMLSSAYTRRFCFISRYPVQVVFLAR